MRADGSYSNEFEAAFDCSRRTQEYPKEQSKLNALIAAGRFVVVLRYDVFCNFTDASLGVAVQVISDHDTLTDARAAFDALASDDDSPEYCYSVEYQAPPEEIAQAEIDPLEIPF